MKKSSQPLVVICGPTASGKTALAIKLAKEFDGEIISADSRAVYRGLDIGTAKPPLEERQEVPHWGIDLIDPGERFTAVDFKTYAEEKIADIRMRGKVPILVGGTGLYIDSIIFDYHFPSEVEAIFRDRLSAMSLQELHEYCADNNIALPENSKNRRYVINTIVRQNQTMTRRKRPIDHCIIVGITTEKEELRRRIEARARTITGSLVVEEAKRVAAKFGWENEAMTANIYPLMRHYIEQSISLGELRQAFATLDWRLAKRQLTWLRRNEYIKWLSLNDAYTYCARRLVNLNNS